MMVKNALAGVLLALVATGVPSLGTTAEAAETLTIAGAGATFPAALSALGHRLSPGPPGSNLHL